MSFLIDPTVRFLEKVANYRVARQEVVTANIANNETPGYTSREIPFEAYLSKASDTGNISGPRMTDRRHIGTPSGPGAVTPPVEFENEPARIDGNNVVLEREVTKMAENGLGYMTAVTLAARKLRGVRNAIDDASRV